MIRYIVNIILTILPISRFFSLKRILLRLAGLELKDGVQINGHTWFYGRGRVIIGMRTWIGPRCKFYTSQQALIRIGDNCDIAPEVVFVVGSHLIGNNERRAAKGYCKEITIGNGCWIGCRATIIGGVQIGSGVIVAAGALVNKDVPNNTLVAGVPAKVLREIE